MRLLCKILLLVMLSFPVFAQAPVYKEDAQNASGYWYSRIWNNTDRRLHCWIGYSEFYVNPRSSSRWYGYADAWSCTHI